MIADMLQGYQDNHKPFLLINNEKTNQDEINLSNGETMAKQSYNGIKIKKRPDGRFYATKQINGKRTYINGKTQTEVYEKVQQLFPKVLQKSYTPVYFYEYWEDWVERFKKPNVKKDTLKNYYSIFKNQIKVYFKDKPIKNIKVDELNRLINDIPTDRMREYTSQYLRECFKQAYRDGVIRFDIWNEIKKFHCKRQEGNALTQEQRKTLIKQANTVAHGEIFIFYLFTGVRMSEGLKLKFEDIEDNFIHIRGTKTVGSDRYIPKFQPAMEVINKMNRNNQTVFGISEVTLKRTRLELCKLCGFHFMTKDLRTTFATMCAEKGIAQSTIAKWLGHTTTQTTSKYYIKVLSDYEKAQQAIIEAEFRNTFATLPSQNKTDT